MNRRSAKIHIGTSGWSYTHWKENFYPSKLKSTDWLNYYSSIFSTVEVNTTFYHLPLLTTIKNWSLSVPNKFTFSIKASRYITHLKRLKDCKESLKLLFSRVDRLNPKVGPILFQLPPSFRRNDERLSEFIRLLDDQHEYTFEFRHNSWFTKEIYELLSDHNIALCITDLNGSLTPMEITSRFTYIRLHGPHKAYAGSYGLNKLKRWKRKIDQWFNERTSVYCYFDNDEKGYAIEDAKLLQELIYK
jgi:uncharacterized protein YecE (DUF72 family)